MISPQYQIQQPEASGTTSESLAVTIQVDTNGLCLLRSLDGRPVDIRYYKLDAADNEQYYSELTELLEENRSNTPTSLILNWPDHNLVPDALYTSDANKEITELVHGDLLKGTILNEAVDAWELHNVYRLPSALHELLRSKFPNAKSRHIFSAWLNCMQESQYKNSIHLIIYPSHFLVLLTQEENLQFSQRFNYEADDDVLFYLLSICKSFHLEPTDVSLVLAGFILNDSALHRSVARIFQHIAYWQPTLALPDSGGFPQHFFSPILNFSQCE